MYRALSMFLSICVLLASLLSGCRAATQPATATPPPTFSQNISPDQMALEGDYVTQATLPANCPHLSLSGMPQGSIIIGANSTCDPSAWKGGSATAQLTVPALDFPVVLAIELSWPTHLDRGLRAYQINQTAQILFDGQVVWQKRAAYLDQSEGVYYAAKDGPVLLSVVVHQPGQHSLTVQVPEKMAWDIGSIEVTSHSYPGQVLGVAYSPYRDNQIPGNVEQPSADQITSDLIQIGHMATAIRLYSSTGISGEIPALANQIGLSVYAGAWLDADPAGTSGQGANIQADDGEVDGLIQVGRTAHIEAAIVGNEYCLRHFNQPCASYLLNRIEQVRSQLPGIPVATAETDGIVFDWTGSNHLTPTINPTYRPVLDAVDILLVHIYPFWGNLPVEGAADYTIRRYEAMRDLIQATYPGQNKRVIIGEAGWPAMGAPSSPSQSSLAQDDDGQVPVASTFYHPADQRRYMIELLALAQQEGVDLFYFDAFDELWKAEGAGGVGRSWGFEYSDRSSKYDFTGLLLPASLLPDPQSGGVWPEPYPVSSAVGTMTVLPLYTEWPRDLTWQSDAAYDNFSPAFMGDIDHLVMNQADRSDPHSGLTDIRFDYQSGGSNHWAGVYWLYPDQNWGEEPGLDLSAARSLQFWARGDKGGEVVEFFLGGVCGVGSSPACPDSIQPKLSIGNVILSKGWTQYTIDLRNMDLSSVVGGFGFAATDTLNPAGATFHLDDITFNSNPPDSYPVPNSGYFHIYTDFAALDNHYIPSDFIGDGETAGNITIAQDWTEYPHSGQTAIQIKYTISDQGWGGVYWTDPENNWGERPGGYDLTGAGRLTFWARAEQPASVTFMVGGIGYNNGGDCTNPLKPYPDSVCPVIKKQVYLTTEWEQYSIDLADRNVDLNRVLGGFGWVSSNSVEFYLDDIAYEFDHAP